MTTLEVPATLRVSRWRGSRANPGATAAARPEHRLDKRPRRARTGAQRRPRRKIHSRASPGPHGLLRTTRLSLRGPEPRISVEAIDASREGSAHRRQPPLARVHQQVNDLLVNRQRGAGDLRRAEAQVLAEPHGLERLDGGGAHRRQEALRVAPRAPFPLILPGPGRRARSSRRSSASTSAMSPGCRTAPRRRSLR